MIETTTTTTAIMTIEAELKRCSQEIRTQLAAIDVERLRGAVETAERRYQELVSAIDPLTRGQSAEVGEVRQRADTARQAFANADNKRAVLVRQLARCDRLLTTGARDAAAELTVTDVETRIKALTGERADAAAVVERLDLKLRSQRQIDTDASAKLACSLATNADEAVSVFGEAVATARPSEAAELLGFGIAKATDRVAAIDRQREATADDLREAERLRAAARLDVLELQHAGALSEYVRSLATYRAQHRVVYGIQAPTFDYEELADTEPDLLRVIAG